jgi:UDP:flavonoid glycosyltransferase YjiC (YdhE family)
MKILFSSGPLYGHVNPMLSLALAARRAGHDVVFATARDLAAHVERFGLAVWPVGLTHAEAGGSRHGAWLNYFAQAAVPRAAELVPRALQWRPDLVVHEETELAGPAVATLCDARHVVHGLGMVPSMRIWPAFAEAAARIGAPWLQPSDLTARLVDATYLRLSPPSLQPEMPPSWRHVQPLRPVMAPPGARERLPFDLNVLPFEHSIHLTLGTVFTHGTAVLREAIKGLRDLGCNVIVAVGPDGDPDAFGPQPLHVRIERYVPHALLLPRCRLVVSQGGAGVMFGALGLGLPQLLLPQGADQFVNAEALARSGAGEVLGPAEAAAARIAASASRLLADVRFTRAARTVQAELAAMPDADAVLHALVTAPRRCTVP